MVSQIDTIGQHTMLSIDPNNICGVVCPTLVSCQIRVVASPCIDKKVIFMSLSIS